MMKDPTHPNEQAVESGDSDKSSQSSGQIRQTEFQRTIERAGSPDRRDREAKIRQRAHELWEQEGRPEGRADTHWERAAQELDREDAASQREGVAGAKPGVRPQGDADFAREKS